MARSTEMSQADIDAKLAALEEEPQPEEVEVEPEQEEVEEVEEESATSEDDTAEEEPLTAEGDEDDEEEEVELTKSESGLIEALKAERTKRQEAAEELRSIKDTLKELQETFASTQQPKTLEDAYERDPKGVISNINAKIAEAQSDGDALEVERLRDLKDDLKNSASKKKEVQLQQKQKQTEIQTALFTKIPTWNQELAVTLTEFAIEQLEYTDEALREKTHLGKHGVAAVDEIARIYKLYEKSKAPEKAKKKRVKQATKVEKSGTGGKVSTASHSKLIKEARETGDWSKVLEERGL